MKYMGSKRAMLEVGLAEVIEAEMPRCRRFYDLFTGSGSVACYVAENYQVEVVATDLQEYAAVLARSVIGRSEATSFDSWAPEWIAAAVARAERHPDAISLANLQTRLTVGKLPRQASRARKLSAVSSSDFVRAYGGWYFSPWQAILLDSLRQEADANAFWYDIAVASVIQAASRCVAAPGHTAQPFKADTGAAPYLLESWQKDIVAQVTVSAASLSERRACIKGEAYSANANEVALNLQEGDVAFLDPPYSSVHYSRFYHVLESIARGTVGEVSGMGRYPAPEHRPSSDYSIPTRSKDAIYQLLTRIADTGATAIVTFPSSETSNRLSGEEISRMAEDRFRIGKTRVHSRFSTMGGNHKHRSARHDTEELILTLYPK
ncbi:MAG TPA: DNA adenine methylase [Sphingorhabdus sp.]|jgi:adenine-specific DNA methylase|nr:DNA adenine methylase [Sphingorhabdus sp.]